MYSKKINQLATNLNPQITDLIPVGDAVTGQLKTATYGGVSGITGDGVISGGIVTWTGTGLVFNISACTYILNGVRYSSPLTSKTLAVADPTNPRIDVFAVNTSGQVEVIQGIPNINPVEPEGDTPTTLGLTNVTIAAGATTPSGVTRDLIYDENVESWTKIVDVGGGTTYNLADTAFANTGTKSILATMGAGFIFFNFSKAVAMDISNYKSLSFWIRLNTAWISNTALSVRFYNTSNNTSSNLFQINSTNNVGFNRNLAGEWQLITIPFNNTNLRFTNNAFTQIRISTSNAAATYRLDTIQLNGGINNPIGGGTTPSNSFGFVNATTGTASSTTATDTLNVVGSGLITTSATGKTLTIASNQIATGSILGRVTAGSGNIETLTGTQATTLLDVFTSSLKGLAPASGGGTTNFLRADGTWAAPAGGGGSMAIGGSITSATAGSILFAGTSGVLAQDNANFFWDDSNNKLGIGTNSPANELHIIKNTAATANIKVQNSLGGSGILLNGNSGSFEIGKSSTSATPYKILAASDAVFYNGTSGDYAFMNDVSGSKFKWAMGGSSTAQMTLTAAGRLLIGTTTESTFILDVNGTTRLNGNLTTNLPAGSVAFIAASGVLSQNNSNFFWDNTNNNLYIGNNTTSATDAINIVGSNGNRKSIVLQNTNSGGNSSFYFQNNRGSFSSYGGLLHGGSIYTATFFGNAASDKTILLSDGANSGGLMIGTIANTFLIFGTNNTERARITAGGEVYIAGTTDQGAYNLQVNGTGVWGAGAYVNGSDLRLKENIIDLENCLELVNKMKPVTYNYKESYSKDNSIQTGFIAQEIKELLKDKNYVNGIVKEGPEYLSLAYQNLIPILVKAIQELKLEIEIIKNK